MIDLKIQNGAIEINGENLLERINFEVKEGDHIAVVGPNGAGKTTLLKAIIDNEMLSEGIDDEKFQIIKTGNFKIGYLEQIKLDESLTLLDDLTNSFEEIIKLEKKIEFLAGNLNDDKNILAYSNALDRYQYLGGYNYRKTIEIMIHKFGFKEEDKNKILSEFSGGEKMKISFMKLLLSSFDLLILDEPTNHLDILAIEWLETYLKNNKKAFIVVSHDRMFLDNTVDIVYSIEYGETVKYVGNYSKYVKQKEERYQKLLKDYELQQSEIKRLQSLYERFRSKPTKAKMALSKLKQIERMSIIEKPKKENNRSFTANMKNIEKPSKIVLEIKNLEFGYDKALGKLNLEVERGKKIGIIGRNGIGKSTLLKTLNKVLKPYSGKINYGYHVTTAFFDQSLNFKTNGTILEEFCHTYQNISNEEARSALGMFLFSGQDVEKNLNVLSGGEKVRLLLCEIFYGKANLIFLDEPTNHLDLIGKSKLEKMLKEYPETIIFVSHDRYFVKELADELIVFEENEINYYPYGYEDYLKNKKEIENNLDVKKKKQPKPKLPKENNDQILKKIEKEIEILNNEIKKLTNEMYNEENIQDYQKLNAISNEINGLKEELTFKEQKWEKIIENMEDI